MAEGKVVIIDGDRIIDDATLHDEFARVLGFPEWYGRNWNAWIDLLTYLDDDRETTSFWVLPGQVVTLQIQGVKSLRERLPELYSLLIDCAAFVNWRRLEAGDTAYLCLSFYE